ncbi:type I-G CRISPR-associated helicase/endonuclease Cas3g [Embleya sp. NPDC001921]
MSRMTECSFVEFVRTATGSVPYAYQETLARDDLPQVLCVPTGCGKTVAAVLPWLWRRLAHPRSAVRRATPGRLVYVLPLRSSVEQTHRLITDWIGRLGHAAAVDVRVLSLGAEPEADDWQVRPARPTVLIGTQDLVLSRLLMRGHGEWRASWPLSFGLLHAGTRFVFDEPYLMGPGLETSAQLQGLRDELGTVGGSSTMWMTAMPDASRLGTPDHPTVARVVNALDLPLGAELARRVEAARTIEFAAMPASPASYPTAVAEELLRRHRPGTRTMAILNTDERAGAVRAALDVLAAGQALAPEVLGLHARFRPPERAALIARLAEEPGPAGQVVVTTQVVEAGVDVTARVLLTEVAPWPSIVQRAGRCNRDGREPDARLLWTWPPVDRAGDAGHAPYAGAELRCAARALTDLEGHAVTTARLPRIAVAAGAPVRHVLRRADLMRLFDTLPAPDADDAGAEEVARWIRDDADPNVAVTWRHWPGGRPDEREPYPRRVEICPAPVAEVADALARRPSGWWTFDRAGGCRALTAADLRPGAVVLAAAEVGCYDVASGWGSRHPGPVPVVRLDRGRLDNGSRENGSRENGSRDESPRDDSLHDDRLPADAERPEEPCAERWVDLPQHLADVERDVRTVAGELAETGFVIAGHLVASAALAGRYHDLGKAHAAFQAMLCDDCPPGAEPPGPGPWAKSGHDRGRHSRAHFRHELVSVLALLHPEVHLLTGVPDADLITYLVAAHHGQVRVSIRPMPDEVERAVPRVLGVETGDRFGPVEVPGDRRVPAIVLDPTVLLAGGTRVDPRAGAWGAPGAARTPGTSAAWTARVLRLCDAPGLGPFRLGFLEALVRVADRRVSRSYGRPAPPP